jgi:terminase small subunit / prophage DNA-packing protein
MKFDSKTTVSARELGELIGCTDRATRSFAERKIIKRASRGRFALIASLRAILEHYREVAAGRGGEGAMLDLTVERARLAKVQREQIELRNAILTGELLRHDDVVRLWAPLVVGFRGRALSWPGKALHVCPTLTLADKAALSTMTEDDLNDARLGVGFDFKTKAPDDEVPNGEVRKNDD